MPGRLAAAAPAAGRPVFLVGLEASPIRAVLAPFPARIHPAGRRRAHLARLAGAWLPGLGADRSGAPSVAARSAPDAEGARILARIGSAAFAGDDGLLAAVIRVLGEEGFRVLGAHEVLTEALGPLGLLSRGAPDALAMADIARAVEVARALGAADVGQGCVVQQGIVLAVEAAEGTDAMLARCAGLARPGPGGVLVKLVKPGSGAPGRSADDRPGDRARGAAEAGLARYRFRGGRHAAGRPRGDGRASGRGGAFPARP